MSDGVGHTLRMKRVARRMTLAEASRVTRIPLATLEALEEDRFDELPGEVFVRGFLRSYAKTLGLRPAEILAMYGASRRVSLATPLPVASHVTAASDGRGRKFGVAVAFVLLFILFTVVALSIVLRPRGRDLPMELSSVDGASAPAAPRGRG